MRRIAGRSSVCGQVKAGRVRKRQAVTQGTAPDVSGCRGLYLRSTTYANRVANVLGQTYLGVTRSTAARRAAGKMISGETTLRVRYAETDRMGVVYHTNFAIWFEVGRVELLRQLGFEYSSMEKDDNCHIPVVDLRVRYKAPALYDDEIVIRTELRNARRSLLHFGYEIRRANGDGALLATGETTHIIVDRDLRRCPLPEKYMNAFGSRLKAANTQGNS